MIRLFCISLCLCLTLYFSQAKDDSFASSTSIPLMSPPPPENYNQMQNKVPFNPSITITVGALSVFSITFLIFLYVKHCKTGNNGYPNMSTRGNIEPYTPCKASGIDPNIIDLLPVFRFSSLKGQKDGLECAVCLTNYEALEVLRLLPKCKHAFHVECIDTWLDTHSTCPLCRYRVDPEDVLLIEHNKSVGVARQDQYQLNHDQEFFPACHQTPGRHSSAGEGKSNNSNGHLQITGQKSMGSRRSLDSSMKSKKDIDSVSIGCFKSVRKDGLLLSGKENKLDRQIQHRIVVSSNINQQRWSDVRPSDMLYIRSEMLMSDSRRVSVALEKNDKREGEGIKESGRRVINERSVSEITSRKRSNEVVHQQRQEGFVSRWLAWISDTSNYTPSPLPVSPSTSTSIP